VNTRAGRATFADQQGGADVGARQCGRVAVAIGSGFTGRLTLGKRPMPWRQVADYIRCLKALLAGETALWEGAKIRMLQLPGFGAERPIDVPILIGADGPKGLAVAAELGDGVFSAALPQPEAAGVTDWRALLSFGTVLDEGEDLNSPRVIDAAGPAAVVLYHSTYERGGATAVDALPGGQAWREAIEAYPETERHLVIHEGHLIKANPRDEPHVADLMAFASSMGLTGTGAQVFGEDRRTGCARSHRGGVPAGRIRHWARAARLRVCRWPSEPQLSPFRALVTRV
jgi:5,10-methylenetetrahydromethanopterin reductase